MMSRDATPRRCFTRDYELGRSAAVHKRCRGPVSDGAALPFADSSFAAISHSDAPTGLVQRCESILWVVFGISI